MMDQKEEERMKWKASPEILQGDSTLFFYVFFFFSFLFLFVYQCCTYGIGISILMI